MGAIFDEVGQVFREHGDSVKEASRVINAETDIRIFIEYHSSKNPLPIPENFEGQHIADSNT
jgi:hypothetical protein